VPLTPGSPSLASLAGDDKGKGAGDDKGKKGPGMTRM